MSEIRVIVSHRAPSAEAAEADTRSRVERCLRNETEIPGCLQFEVFRSVVHPENFILVERWVSEEAYNDFLNKHSLIVNNPPPPRPPDQRSTVELYKRQTFEWVDGAWTNAERLQPTNRVRW